MAGQSVSCCVGAEPWTGTRVTQQGRAGAGLSQVGWVRLGQPS